MIPGVRVNTESQFKRQDLKRVAGDSAREVQIQAAFIPGLGNPQFAGELRSPQPMEEQKCSDKWTPPGANLFVAIESLGSLYT